MAKSQKETLTDELVASKQHTIERYRVFDDQVTGFCLQVMPSGRKTFLLITTVGFTKKNIILGTHPDVPTSDAREKARALLSEIAAARQADRDERNLQLMAHTVVPASPKQLQLLQVATAMESYFRAEGVKGMTPEEARLAELVGRKTTLMAVLVAVFEADSGVVYDESYTPWLLLEFLNGRADELNQLLQVAKAHNRAFYERLTGKKAEEMHDHRPAVG